MRDIAWQSYTFLTGCSPFGGRKKQRQQAVTEQKAKKMKRPIPPREIFSAVAKRLSAFGHLTHFQQKGQFRSISIICLKASFFSNSKIVCVDASATSPSIHAIGTPQNGGKKGKLCFIEDKGTDFILSTQRQTKEKHRKSSKKAVLTKNKCAFLRKRATFIEFPPHYFEKAHIRSPTPHA